MGYAWAPQIVGLTKHEPKMTAKGTKPKHRAKGIAIVKEAMEERASGSPTLDRSRSGQNIYWHKCQGDVSGTATWESMCDDADEYRVKVKMKNGKTAERKLPSDAVIGWAMILKPPPLMIAALRMTDDDIERFCEDAFDVMGGIKTKNGHNFFSFDNLECDAFHHDEDSPHYHKIGKPICNGRYCGNEIDADYCDRINRAFPGLMRARGWPIDDLDVTDWERAKTDDAYREERNKKRLGQGRSTRQYQEDQIAEANRIAADIVAQAAARADNAIAEAKRRISDSLQQGREERDALQAECERLREALTGDLQSFEAQEAKEGAKRLLAAVGASTEPKEAKAINPVRTALMERMMAKAEREKQKSGPTHVEGPTR